MNRRMIESAIEELYLSIGIKEPIYFDDVKGFNLRETANLIAKQLGLPVHVNIIIEYHYYDVPARVFIPPSLPPYGSPYLNNYPIDVRIREECTKNHWTFIVIMAHELSHVLLYSLNNRNKKSEKYTDITAMMLGFYNIFRDGRTSATNETTTIYGYLNDNEFRFAYQKIDEILETYRKRKDSLSKKTIKLIKTISKHNKILCEFQKRLDYLVKHPYIKRMSKADQKRISSFFQEGYIDEHTSPITDISHRLNEKKLWIDCMTHFFYSIIPEIDLMEEELISYSEQLNKALQTVKKDTKMLGKYVGCRYWVNTYFMRYCKAH